MVLGPQIPSGTGLALVPPFEAGMQLSRDWMVSASCARWFRPQRPLGSLIDVAVNPPSCTKPGGFQFEDECVGMSIANNSIRNKIDSFLVREFESPGTVSLETVLR
jgi:hypothetical protein